MSIKSELHEMIKKRGGTPPAHGGVAAALDVLNELPSGGSGGSGGGTLIVNFSALENVYTPDKTLDEITAAVSAGMVVLGIHDGTLYSYQGLSSVNYDEDVYCFTNVTAFMVRTLYSTNGSTYNYLMSAIGDV